MTPSELVSRVYIDTDEPLPTIDTRLVFDEGWSPRCAATFTVPWSPERFAALDPRNYTRVLVEIERRWASALTLDDLTEQWYTPPTPPGPPPVVLATNLFPNPSIETDLAGYTGTRCALTRVAGTWGAGAWVMRATPNVVGNSGSYVTARPGGATNPYLPGRTYTAIVTGHLAAPLTGTLDANARRVLVIMNSTVLASSAQFPNVAGTYPLRVTFTMPTGSYSISEIRLYVGSASGGGAVDWDALMVWEGPDDGRVYFDGSTPDTPTRDYAWTGTAHASTSTQSTVQIPADPGTTLDDLTVAWAGLTLDDLTGRWLIDWGNGARPPDKVTADLVLRERTADHLAATISLRATSDELLAQDANARVDRPVEPLPERLTQLLAAGHVPLGPPPQFNAGAPFVAMAAQSVEWSQSVWDAMSANAASVGLRLWVDEARVWHLGAADQPPVGLVNLPRVVDGSDTVNRDGDYADVLVWVGKGINSDGLPLTETRTWPLAVPNGPYKASVVEHDYGTVGAGLPMPSDEELAARLTLLQTRDRVLTITAVADLTVRPGMGIATGPPSLPATHSTVARVEWAVPADTMTITTRSTTEP